MGILQPNNVKFSVRLSSVFEDVVPSLIPTDSKGTWNQGDLLVWDSVNQLVRVASDEASMVTFLGVARQSLVTGQPIQPYTTLSTAPARENVAGPQFGGVFNFYLKTGDTFTAGAPVYAYTAGGNNYITSGGTKAIGVFQGPTVTASAGDVGSALIGHRYPNDSLQF